MTIGLVGDTQDFCATYVRWVAQQRGVEVVDLPEDELGSHWSYRFDDCDPADGEFEIGGKTRPFHSIAGLLVHLFPRPRLPAACTDLAPEHEAPLIVERRAGLQHLLATFPRNVINPPSAGRSNASKPYQMRTLADAGFRVPPWIASNDAGAIRAFVAALPDGAVYKACSGLRSRVRRVDEALLARVTGSTPIVAQQYIAGRDVRVHTVLDAPGAGAPHGRIFPTEVRAQDGVDYRFDPGDHAFAPTDVPEPLAQLCFRVAAREGLVVAGFDFRVTDDGVWYCLEVNPVPTFITYQAATGQPIGEAIVDRLLA